MMERKLGGRQPRIATEPGGLHGISKAKDHLDPGKSAFLPGDIQVLRNFRAEGTILEESVTGCLSRTESLITF